MNVPEWRDLAAAAAVIIALVGFVMWLLRAKLSDDFARKGDVTAISDRLGLVEKALRDVPSHGDVRAVTDRVADMVGKVGVLEAHVMAVDSGVKRVEHDLRLLITSMIGKEDRQP